jgi:hypothetical protein
MHLSESASKQREALALNLFNSSEVRHIMAQVRNTNNNSASSSGTNSATGSSGQGSISGTAPTGGSGSNGNAANDSVTSGATPMEVEEDIANTNGNTNVAETIVVPLNNKNANNNTNDNNANNNNNTNNAITTASPFVALSLAAAQASLGDTTRKLGNAILIQHPNAGNTGEQQGQDGMLQR